MSERPEEWEGQAFEVAYPFYKEDRELPAEDGSVDTIETWVPGVRYEMTSPEDAEPFADGVGAVIYSVVSVHRPGGRYPPRVFFTRRWRSPDGKDFGKNGLRVMTATAFANRLLGHPAKDWTLA